MKKLFGLLLTVALFSSSAFAATLGIGDPAPALKVSKWVKGDPIDSLDPSRTYVVEFWATWCPPCRYSIPHLTELAKKYPNVTFIGMDVWERVADPTAKVEQFVKDMGDKMEYNVAMDTKDQFMANKWMRAAEQDGIPTAFLVQNGTIVWIGHPMGDLDKMIGLAEAGTIDVAALKKEEEVRQKTMATIDDYVQAAMAGNTEKTTKLAPEIESFDLADAELLNRLSWFLLTSDRIKTRDIPFATRLAKKAVDLTESKNASVLDTYARALHDGGDLDAAIEIQRKATAADPADTSLAKTLDKYIAESPKAATE